MAAKGSTQVKKFKFLGFENIEFTEEERSRVVDWIDKNDCDVADCITVLVEAKWKVGVGYDDYSQVNAVSMTCKDPSSRYFGYCFIFKHTDVARGLKIARFMFDFYFREELYALEKKNKAYDW